MIKKTLVFTLVAVLLFVGLFGGSLMTFVPLEEAYAAVHTHYYGCTYREDGTRLYCAHEETHDHSVS